jgi:predicted 3-demethylubiquinone-9 3-methyltransferase (glyoxalase superfamily)
LDGQRDAGRPARLTRDETTFTEHPMQKIHPFLWFNDSAEEAVKFYLSVFKNSKMTTITRYQEGGMGPAGSVMTIAFQLDGQEFVALNGGPSYTITPAISFVVNCDTQEEIDYYWDKLSDGGLKVQCGWLQDKFGVSWQVVPPILIELLSDPDAAKSQRVMQAMLKMIKLDINELKRAAAQS